MNLGTGYDALVERIREMASRGMDGIEVQWMMYAIKHPLDMCVCDLSGECDLIRCLASSTTHDTIYLKYTLLRRAMPRKKTLY